MRLNNNLDIYEFYTDTINNNNVVIHLNNTATLFSYDTKVITIDYSKEIIYLYRGFDYSVTTNKYTNQFLVQLSVKDIKKALTNGNTINNGYGTTYTIIDER